MPSCTRLVFNTQLWAYYPGYFADQSGEMFSSLFEFLEVGTEPFTKYRHSCLFTSPTKDGKVPPYSYFTGRNIYRWADSPALVYLKDRLEKELHLSFDYCLAHIYLDGHGSIGYHNDEESLQNPIVSVSFGATRKFRFRHLDQTKGYAKQFHLKSGDVIVMHTGCQKVFKHSVPKELKVTEPRINLTFRKFT